MAQAILSRGTTSVTIDIWRQGGELALARDVGKPSMDVKPVSRDAPRSADHKSAQDIITLLGVLKGPGAYSTAASLVEDLIKPHSDGTPLQLDLTEVTGFDSIFEVGVPSDRACELDYRPGIRNHVDVQLSLPIVSSTVG